MIGEGWSVQCGHLPIIKPALFRVSGAHYISFIRECCQRILGVSARNFRLTVLLLLICGETEEDLIGL